MNKRTQGFAIGVLVCSMLSCGYTFAKQANEYIQIHYSNIKIFNDGAEVTPKDADGNIVEPFIYDGTTYLPARAIANALGKEVEWDGETSSIYIGKKDETKPEAYLSELIYNDYKEGASLNDVAVINGNVTDYDNNTYTNGLIFLRHDASKIDNDADKAQILISYPLDSKYKKLKGKIVLPQQYNLVTWGENKNCKTNATDVLFYGDGKLLYNAINVTTSKPFPIDIDIQNINQLTIKIKTQSGYGFYVALTDLALFK